MHTTVKLIQYSESQDGVSLATMELVYPRFIHSEFMTHRVFSRNAASSRAIPIKSMMEQVCNDPAMPTYWGLNKAGMQAGDKHSSTPTCAYAWKQAAKRAVESAKELDALGLHKQLVNRVLEPFQWMKTVVTSTDWDNFFDLRCHPDAQPEIQDLAIMMKAALLESKPVQVAQDEWHVPYVDRIRMHSNRLAYFTGDLEVTKDQALRISASCCAQVSYRNLDDSLDKAIKIYDRLIGSKPAHASPFEHQATPQVAGYIRSGNLRGWKQYRKTLKL